MQKGQYSTQVATAGYYDFSGREMENCKAYASRNRWREKLCGSADDAIALGEEAHS
jgi:hypothetical protein